MNEPMYVVSLPFRHPSELPGEQVGKPAEEKKEPGTYKYDAQERRYLTFQQCDAHAEGNQRQEQEKRCDDPALERPRHSSPLRLILALDSHGLARRGLL